MRIEDQEINEKKDTGSVTVKNSHGSVHCLSIIGQVEGHYLLGDSWARCSQRILNYRFSEAAKFRVYRYFGII